MTFSIMINAQQFEAGTVVIDKSQILIEAVLTQEE